MRVEHMYETTAPAATRPTPGSGRRIDIRPGDPLPLGATPNHHGTNFSIFSEVAERVDLCLYGEDGRETCVTLPERTAHCFHGYVLGVKPGQRYGYRVHGPWNPA